PETKALIAKRTTALRQRLSVFGSGSRAPGLFGLGPNRELLGREVEALEPGEPGAVNVEIDQERELRAVDLAAEYVPARLTGHISGGDGEAPHDLAVSVNGRVVAVARSFVFEGEERLSVLVPESALRSGANDVELYWVTRGPADGLTLRSLWATQ
ncbi:MAG: hypothetical protein ACRDQ2_11875, partial [Gaiellales bacterium]